MKIKIVKSNSPEVLFKNVYYLTSFGFAPFFKSKYFTDKITVGGGNLFLEPPILEKTSKNFIENFSIFI